jgi:HK97 family phage major capsid protein
MMQSKNVYSLAAAIADAAAHDGVLTRGLELEATDEIAARSGRKPRGFWVPWNAELRNLGFGTAAGQSGLATAQTTIPQNMLIDALRAKLAVERLGGKILNLTPEVNSGGGVKIPVKTSAASVSWVDDGAAPASESNFVVAAQTLTPHTCSAYTDVTRRMLSLGQPGFQAKVVEDLLIGLAVGIDQAALNGSGTGFTPLGLFQTGGITQLTCAADSGNGGVPSYADLIALEKTIGVAGGDSPADARVGLVTSPAGRSIFRRTAKLSGGTATPCWEVNTGRNPRGEWESVETCIGYASVATTNVVANIAKGTGSNLTTACLGNFADLVVNLFTGFDVLVNPYMQSLSGIVRVSAFVDVDAIVQHTGSFAILTAINAT